MTRSTQKIVVSSENFDFAFSAFLTADPKIAEFCHRHYFVVVLNDKKLTQKIMAAASSGTLVTVSGWVRRVPAE